jgi:hypothetical protein
VSKFIALYRGPSAWLVRLAQITAFATLAPIWIEILVWLYTASKVNFGDLGMIVIGVSVWTLWIVARVGYVCCVPALAAASVLLLNRTIPRRVRLLAAGFDLAACAILLWEVSRLRAQLNHGILG